MAATQVLDILAQQQTPQAPASAPLPQSGTTLESLTEKFRFDAVVSRQHGFSAQVTEAPVEDGSTINDHIILAPRTLVLEALVSDHPLENAAITAAQSAAEVRSVSAAAYLEQLWATRTLLTVVTRLRRYTGMAIERMDFSESAEVGEALAVVMTLREVRKVALAMVPIAKLATATVNLAAGPVKLGRKKKKPLVTEQVTSIQSATEAAYGQAPSLNPQTWF